MTRFEITGYIILLAGTAQSYFSQAAFQDLEHPVGAGLASRQPKLRRRRSSANGEKYHNSVPSLADFTGWSPIFAKISGNESCFACWVFIVIYFDNLPRSSESKML